MEQKEITKRINELSFEDALKRLEQVVELLESDNIELDKTIELYQEGILLAHHCDQKLSQAEQKIEILMDEKGEPTIRDFTIKEE